MSELTTDVQPEPVRASVDPIVELFADGSRNAGLLAWADENGLDRSTAMLASELAQAGEDGQAAFVQSFVETNGGTRRDSLRWFFWLMVEAKRGIQRRFPDMRNAAIEEVLAIHHRVIAGEAIGNPEWRAARRRFKEGLQAGTPMLAMDAVLASMWDLKATPGAIADVAQTWIREVPILDSVEPSGWTWPEYRRVMKAWDDFSIAHARIPREPDESDEAFHERTSKMMPNDPPGINDIDFDRWEAMETLRRQQHELVIEELRDGLIQIAKTSRA